MVREGAVCTASLLLQCCRSDSAAAVILRCGTARVGRVEVGWGGWRQSVGGLLERGGRGGGGEGARTK